MKLYHYNPNHYGEQFFVLAEDKTKAHECLLKYLESKTTDGGCYSEMYREDFESWKKVNPLDSETFPPKYILDEHEAGSVIQSEIA